MRLNPDSLDEAEQLDDCRTKIEQLEEIEKDITKQLRADHSQTVDSEQLSWLTQRLIESWHTESVRGRVIFFHHPPYVTEATKWYQGQTLAVRQRLRSALDEVAAAIGNRRQANQQANQPVVDLVLNGHAHCFEHLQTGDTGGGDAHTHWLVCGGSGYSLRRQREEGPDIWERGLNGQERHIASSRLFVGRSGQGNHKRRPYSFLRIDVQAGSPPRFVVRPHVAERYQHQWLEQSLPPFEI